LKCLSAHAGLLIDSDIASAESFKISPKVEEANYTNMLQTCIYWCCVVSKAGSMGRICANKLAAVVYLCLPLPAGDGLKQVVKDADYQASLQKGEVVVTSCRYEALTLCVPLS